MATGTIKKIIAEKNFGFIGIEGQSKDLFFHGSELQGGSMSDFREGDTVSFEIEESDKGPKAVGVVKA